MDNNSDLPLPMVLIETISDSLRAASGFWQSPYITWLIHLLCDGVWASVPHSTIKHFKYTDNSTVSIPAAIFLNCKNHNTCAIRLAVCLLFSMSYNNPRLPRPSHFPFICWVVPLAAVSYSTDHQLCAVRTPFRCRLEIPPLSAVRSQNCGLKRLYHHNYQVLTSYKLD